MIDRIYDYMLKNKMIGRGSRILVAVSGGADSMCLLEVLRELQSRARLQLRVLHVHHGLRESAERDLLYVAKYCKSAEIPFEAVRVNAAEYAAGEHLSLEEGARQLRYAALEDAARRWDDETARSRAVDDGAENRADSTDVRKRADGENALRPAPDQCRIAVAHHVEDQAETVLFHLVRGSRLAGLRGMLPVTGRIIRPLLECSRAEIEEFLTRRGISWQEDETNEDTAYTRNLLRREVMPLLKQINVKAQQHIAKAAQEAAEAEEFLKKETQRALAACCTEHRSGASRTEQSAILPGTAPPPAEAGIEGDGFYIISIPALLREAPLIGRRVIYEVTAKAAGRKKDLQDVHVRDVLQLAKKQGNGRLDVFGGVTVEKVYDKLIFSAGKEQDPSAERRRAAASAQERRWPMDAAEYSCRVFGFDGDMTTVSRNQYTKWFDYDKIGALPSFRTRRSGDRITLDESKRSKALRRCMIDAKIPADLRDKIVFPTRESEILWIPAGKADETAGICEGDFSDRAGDEKSETEKSETKRGKGCPKDSGRISAAYRVSSRTRRILEIRWEPAR